MIDPFVLLAPVLLLAVVALLRFVGCDRVFGLQPIPPSLFSIMPMSKTMGEPEFMLTANGVGFVNGSKVQWNGSDLNRPTTFVSEGQLLTVTITADHIATAGTAKVTVFVPGDNGGTVGPLEFTILESVTVKFNQLGPAPNPPGYAALDGPYIDAMSQGALDFLTGMWFWKGSGVGNTIFLGPANDAGFHMGSFKFNKGNRVLKSVSVSYTGTPPPTSGTITLKDDNIPPQTASMSINPGPAQVLLTNWDPLKPSAAVTVTSDVGWNLEIDEIVYYGPL